MQNNYGAIQFLIFLIVIAIIDFSLSLPVELLLLVYLIDNLIVSAFCFSLKGNSKNIIAIAFKNKKYCCCKVGRAINKWRAIVKRRNTFYIKPKNKRNQRNYKYKLLLSQCWKIDNYNM